jgi:hypothetical protein
MELYEVNLPQNKLLHQKHEKTLSYHRSRMYDNWIRIHQIRFVHN